MEQSLSVPTAKAAPVVTTTTASYNLPITTSFKKAVKLPNKKRFIVDSDQIVLTGEVTCCIRKKRLFFSTICSMEQRKMTLTKSGYLVLYVGVEQGHILRVPDARQISTSYSVKYCLIELEYTFGTLVMTFKMNQGILWAQALLKYMNKRTCLNYVPSASRTNFKNFTQHPLPSVESVKTQVLIPQSRASTTTLKSAEGVLSVTETLPAVASETSSSEVKTTHEAATNTSIVAKKDSDSAGPSVVEPVPICRKPCPFYNSSSGSSSNDETKAPEELPSIRTGYHGVASLREKLEQKLRSSKYLRSRRQTTMVGEKPQTAPKSEAVKASAELCVPAPIAKATVVTAHAVVIPSRSFSTRDLRSCRSASAPSLNGDAPKITKRNGNKIAAPELYHGCYKSVRA